MPGLKTKFLAWMKRWRTRSHKPKNAENSIHERKFAMADEDDSEAEENDSDTEQDDSDTEEEELEAEEDDWIAELQHDWFAELEHDWFGGEAKPDAPLREIPIEVWENVIDQLQDDKEALCACARVCRGWAPRSRHYLQKWLVLKRPAEVSRLAKLVRTGHREVKSCRTVRIRSTSLRTLGLFATMFAAKLPSLETLVVAQGIKSSRPAVWVPGQTHVDVFHYLSTFTSITHLILWNVEFPSVQIFGRFISTLPGLTSLQCQNVKFEAHDLRVGAFLQRPRNLATLILDTEDDLQTMDGIGNLLAGTQMASTLKDIAIGKAIGPDQLDKSSFPVLISSAGKSLRSLDLRLDHNDALGVQLREGARVIDLRKLTSLQQLCITMPAARGIPVLDMGVPWVCRQLAGYEISSTALRSLTLRFPISIMNPFQRATYAPYAARVGLHAQNCQLLDHTLSTPLFTSLEEVLLGIEAYELPDTGRAELQQWVPTQFPQLAARNVLRVLISDGPWRTLDWGLMAYPWSDSEVDQKREAAQSRVYDTGVVILRLVVDGNDDVGRVRDREVN